MLYNWSSSNSIDSSRMVEWTCTYRSTIINLDCARAIVSISNDWFHWIFFIFSLFIVFSSFGSSRIYCHFSLSCNRHHFQWVISSLVSKMWEKALTIRMKKFYISKRLNDHLPQHPTDRRNPISLCSINRQFQIERTVAHTFFNTEYGRNSFSIENDECWSDTHAHIKLLARPREKRDTHHVDNKREELNTK